MKTPNFLFLVAAFLLPSIVVVAQVPKAPARDEAAKRDAQRLQGSWQFTTLVEDGKETPKDHLKNRTVFFGGDGFMVRDGRRILDAGTFKLDPAKNPKTFNMIFAQGTKKGEVGLGIYTLEGETLKVCFDPTGQKRPTDLKSEPGSGHYLAVYQRSKSVADNQQDITGEYVAESTELDGMIQLSDVTIERRGDAYLMTYMKNGAVASVATGIRKGDVFSACFAVHNNAGIVVYEIQKDGRLVGQYTGLGGLGVLADETLTRKKKAK